MNTNGLAQQYDKLTSAERLPLILAASARGDEAEHRRLVASAPKVEFRVPNHFGLTLALREIAFLHFMELLCLTGQYCEASTLAEAWEGGRTQTLNVALIFGYRIKLGLAGWRQFCAEHNFEPEEFWFYLPGFKQVKQVAEIVEQSAWTSDDVKRWIGHTGKEACEVQTADEIAAHLRESLKGYAEWWG